jgi:hypothetical protein
VIGNTDQAVKLSHPDHHAGELLAFISSSFSIASLNALLLTCRALRQLLQPELEGRLTPELARDMLLWAVASKPYILAYFSPRRIQ